MKQLERILLSITRRPIKTILLTLLVFIVANVISGSLILYQSTQSVKEDIQSNIRPVVLFETPFDAANFNEYIKNVSNNTDCTLENIILYGEVFKEIKSLNEVNYSDISLKQYCMTKENIHTKGIIDRVFFNQIDNKYKTSQLLIATDSTESVLIHNKKIEIVEGRSFKKDEIANGENVIILHEDAKYIDNNGNRIPIQIGDTVTVVNRILKPERIENEADEFYTYIDEEEYYEVLKTDAVEIHNQNYKKDVLYEKEYKFKVIGFYQEYNYESKFANHKVDIGDDSIWHYYMLIPQNKLLEINEDYDKNVSRIFNNEEIENVNKSKTGILNNYIELKNSSAIPSFIDEVNKLEKKYNLDMDIKLNNELYLKIAGPLEAVNSVSKLILIVGIVISIVVLSCVSILFMKERRKEIGVLLSMGESKKNIFRQVILEMMIICVLAVGTSLFTTKAFSNQVSETIMGDKTYQIELSEEEKMMIGENYSGVELENEYRKQMDHSNILVVGSISLMITVLSTGISTIFVLRMKPKEILN